MNRAVNEVGLFWSFDLLAGAPLSQQGTQGTSAMTNAQTLLVIGLRHGAAKFRRKEQWVVAKTPLAHRLFQNVTFQFAKRYGFHMAVHG